MTACNVPDCGRPIRARGLCAAHYERQARARHLGRLPRLSLSDEAVRVLCEVADARGVTVDALASEVLEAWAAQRVTR